MRTFLVKLILVLLVQTCSSTISTLRFQGVTVSRTMILDSPILEEFSAPLLSHTFGCSVICGMKSWCDLWCFDPSVDVCFFSNIIVMPGYSADTSEDPLTCYTMRPSDFATGAAIDGTPHYTGRDLKHIGNLIDGIYDLQTGEMCYMSQANSNKPWLLLDFRKPKSVRLVKMMTQPTGLSSWVQSVANLEVRVGLQAPMNPGDFSSFDKFGNYQGPATTYNQEIVIEVAAPMTARYMSIQKMEASTAIQVCHLEVH